MTLIYGADDIICDWVVGHLGEFDFRPAVAIGITDGQCLIAGVIYNNYRPSSRSIEMTIASISPKWCSRSTLYSLFAYPFIQLGVKRVEATSSVHNTKAHRFLEKLGFYKEGIGREAWPHGGDSVMYSLLKHECKWLDYGKKIHSKTAPCSRSN